MAFLEDILITYFFLSTMLEALCAQLNQNIFETNFDESFLKDETLQVLQIAKSSPSTVRHYF